MIPNERHSINNKMSPERESADPKLSTYCVNRTP